MGDVVSSVELHPLSGQKHVVLDGSMMPWWAHALVAEWVGCPEVCSALPAVAKSLKEVCNVASVTHNVYKCRRSGRRLSFPLPGGDESSIGVTPAMFAAAWRRKSRELDDFDLQLSPISQRPVLCPHFGCHCEETTSNAASLHAACCPLRTNGGFAYASPTNILAELETRKLRRVAKVILDANLGGSPGQLPRACMCEVQPDGDQWVLKLRQDGLVQKIDVTSNLCIHRGWMLDDATRTSMERGAFPRGVDRSPFLISHRVSDESYRYSRSCGVHVLSGWVLCDDESSIGRCSNTPGDQSHGRSVLPDGGWDCTLALVLPSRLGSPKWRRADEVRRRFKQGFFSSLYLYIPKIVDLSFPAFDTDESWQTILARHLEQNGGKVSSQVRAEVKSLLDIDCAHPVTEKDLDAEYAFCANDIVFLTFSCRAAAEGFASWLEAAMQNFKVEDLPDCEQVCCHSSPSMLLPAECRGGGSERSAITPVWHPGECLAIPTREMSLSCASVDYGTKDRIRQVPQIRLRESSFYFSCTESSRETKSVTRKAPTKSVTRESPTESVTGESPRESPTESVIGESPEWCMSEYAESSELFVERCAPSMWKYREALSMWDYPQKCPKTGRVLVLV